LVEIGEIVPRKPKVNLKAILEKIAEDPNATAVARVAAIRKLFSIQEAEAKKAEKSVAVAEKPKSASPSAASLLAIEMLKSGAIH
jgi:hypothetical protein